MSLLFSKCINTIIKDILRGLRGMAKMLYIHFICYITQWRD